MTDDVRLHNSLTFHYPTTRDTPEAALAAALFAAKRPSSWPTWDEYRSATGSAVQEPWLDQARLILAAMPPDWCGHDIETVDTLTGQLDAVHRRLRDAEATIARLRKIEEAARAYAGRTVSPGLFDALRAALAESPR